MKPTTVFRMIESIIECTSAQLCDASDLLVTITGEEEYPDFEDDDYPCAEDIAEWGKELIGCCTNQLRTVAGWYNECKTGDGFSPRSYDFFVLKWKKFTEELNSWRDLVFFECDMDEDGSGFVTDMGTLSDIIDTVERALLALFHAVEELDI